MGRAFIPQHNRAATCCLPLPFALHQHMHTAVQRHDLAFLTRDNLAEVFDHAGEVSDLFFEVFHALRLSTARAGLNRGQRLAPSAPFG